MQRLWQSTVDSLKSRSRSGRQLAFIAAVVLVIGLLTVLTSNRPAAVMQSNHRSVSNLMHESMPVPNDAPEAEDALVAHGWPGNVRELENAIERAVVLAHGERITPEDLLLEQGAPSGEAAPEGTLQDSLDRAAAARIRSALEAAKGNRAEAARALGVDRTTLYRLMKRLGLSPLIVSGGGTAGPG